MTGVAVEQPIDEFNRQSGASLGKARVPPSDAEVDGLFASWRGSIPEARKYLPAARDYFAASLWRRLGLRITETVMLDIRDWRPDLGGFGKLSMCGSGRDRVGAASRPAWSLRSTVLTSSSTGGWPRCSHQFGRAQRARRAGLAQRQPAGRGPLRGRKVSRPCSGI